MVVCVFDAERRYRYAWREDWDAEKPTVAFVMLNPSTADEERTDPTIRRCLGFARRWGFGGLQVGNLFALRSTDPRVLRTAADPIGPFNDEALARIQAQAGMVVAAWGVNGQVFGRGVAVKQSLLSRGPVHHLGLTRAGDPRHPLYVPSTAAPQPLGAGLPLGRVTQP